MDVENSQLGASNSRDQAIVHGLTYVGTLANTPGLLLMGLAASPNMLYTVLLWWNTTEDTVSFASVLLCRRADS